MVSRTSKYNLYLNGWKMKKKNNWQVQLARFVTENEQCSCGNSSKFIRLGAEISDTKYVANYEQLYPSEPINLTQYGTTTDQPSQTSTKYMTKKAY